MSPHDSRNSISTTEPSIESEKLSQFTLDLSKQLESNDTLIVLTNKTNRHIIIKSDEHEDDMFNALQKISSLIDIMIIKAFKLQVEKLLLNSDLDLSRK